MSQIQLDPATGEIVRVNGGMARISGAPEIAQHVRVRMRMFRGESPIRQDLGMLYLGGILEKGFQAEEIVGEYRQTAIETPGVVEVSEITLEQTDAERANRVARIRWQGEYDLEDLAERGPVYDTFNVSTSGGIDG